MKKDQLWLVIWFAFNFLCLDFLAAGERAEIIVAKDGSGNFTTIQAAIDAVPKNNNALKIILIKNGVYVEKLMIKTNFIALVGEDRDSTRIQFHQPYSFDSTYAKGRAVINIFANDVTLANLTAENTQPDVNIHGFTVHGDSCTRIIIINCNILSNGGDTLALWNRETGMYYHNTLYLKGAVDFLCPRGWCYAENIEFFCTRKTTPLWHDGSKNQDQKLVVKNATFDGATEFRLARNHLDGAFYLLNCVFSEKLINQPFYRPQSSPAPYKWGRRDYFHNCVRPAGNYEWHKDNLSAAPGSPKPEDITPTWTFAGAWDPEANLPSVLPMAFLPKPDNNQTGVGLAPKLTWVAGRKAKSHKIYFGASNPPQFVQAVAEPHYKPAKLRSNTVYYWRVDEVTDDGVIEGKVWQFRTR
jgi:pectinesterase